MADIQSSGQDSVYVKAAREAVITGIIAFGLFFLVIGFRTDQNINNELVLAQRWGLLAIFVAVAAIGRFIFAAFITPSREQAKLAKSKVPAAAKIDRRSLKATVSRFGLALLFTYPFVVILILALIQFAVTGQWSFQSGVQGSLKYVDNFGIQILIYVMLAWGLNIVVGLAGLLDLGYVAFYAVGAYSYALLSAHFGLLAAPADGRYLCRHVGHCARLSGAAAAG
jgi:branched-chain amino acid transport system permease protein